MVVCSNCDKQIKNNELKFSVVKEYKYVICPNCNSIRFTLVQKVENKEQIKLSKFLGVDKS